jgi:hypothetical protein
LSRRPEPTGRPVRSPGRAARPPRSYREHRRDTVSSRTPRRAARSATASPIPRACTARDRKASRTSSDSHRPSRSSMAMGGFPVRTVPPHARCLGAGWFFSLITIAAPQETTRASCSTISFVAGLICRARPEDEGGGADEDEGDLPDTGPVPAEGEALGVPRPAVVRIMRGRPERMHRRGSTGSGTTPHNPEAGIIPLMRRSA